MSNRHIEPEAPRMDGRKVLSRRSVIGAGVAVAGIATMPLPASADAFSGSYPPVPSGAEAATGGAPVVDIFNDGTGDYIDVMWSTTGSTSITSTSGPSGIQLRSGTPVLFSYTIHLNGVLLAYGTALGTFGYNSWTSGGVTGGFVSGTPTAPNGAYRDGGWRDYPYTDSVSIYMVDTAGTRWKVENWLGNQGYRTPVQY